MFEQTPDRTSRPSGEPNRCPSHPAPWTGIHRLSAIPVNPRPVSSASNEDILSRDYPPIPIFRHWAGGISIYQHQPPKKTAGKKITKYNRPNPQKWSWGEGSRKKYIMSA